MELVFAPKLEQKLVSSPVLLLCFVHVITPSLRLHLHHTTFLHRSFFIQTFSTQAFLQGVFFLSFFSISAWKEISNVEKCMHGVLFAIGRYALILFYFILFQTFWLAKKGATQSMGMECRFPKVFFANSQVRVWFKYLKTPQAYHGACRW